jgi:translation initiation factor 6 (eIF-6)
MTFHGCLEAPPDLGTILVGGKLVGSRALSNTNPGSLKPDSTDPETETGNLETEKGVHRIHGTLETGLQIIPRSLVAPSRGAG